LDRWPDRFISYLIDGYDFFLSLSISFAIFLSNKKWKNSIFLPAIPHSPLKNSGPSINF